ncbi:hypothetical protein J6590_068547 [Homalodisca vitripennis]|nr:hypothetical protein J6590_068547 [Homalodisca vitripennis]
MVDNPLRWMLFAIVMKGRIEKSQHFKPQPCTHATPQHCSRSTLRRSSPGLDPRTRSILQINF